MGIIMTNIAPQDNELIVLIKDREYSEIIRKINVHYATMDGFIDNLNSDINDIGDLLTSLETDQANGYDVGTSLETLTFQKDTLTLDRDFFETQKNTYVKKIYTDLYNYCNGIIDKCIEIEELREGETIEEVKNYKFNDATNPNDVAEGEELIVDMRDVERLLRTTK